MFDAVKTIDYHTGGEPFRIVDAPPVALPGSTVAERRVIAMADLDVEFLRKFLCFEPRGHADMYGGFITPGDDDGANFGVLFWHKDGFSTACGHGTIALGTWAVESGLVPAPATGTTDVVVDVPSGRVTARVHTEASVVTAVDFVNVPSYALAHDVTVDTTLGPLTVSISYGGAIYAHLDVAQLGLTVAPEHVNELIRIGREVKWLLNETVHAKHPTDNRLDGIYGTIIFEALGVLDDGSLNQRNVTIFADGEVDRSPCGSGTCSRIAMLHAEGALAEGQTLVHDSIVGSRFFGRMVDVLEVDGRTAVIPSVTGTAHLTGRSEFVVDPRDELTPGFVLR